MAIYTITARQTPRFFFILSVFVVACISFALFLVGKPAYAAPVVGFNAGNMISDNIFTNSQSMTAAQIQSFLNSKVPSCDTNGALPATEYGRGDLTRAQYAAMRGWSAPPYLCLKDYSEGGKVSAQIIYDAAQEFNINPQVLIVLLQKEQSLVTDTWPLATQFRTATGYGCPDTAACDSQYFGLTNQIRWSARMFRAIMNNSPTWYTPYVLGNNYIQYNPNASCGGSTINITNRSTQALYNYTPYQPNQSALNAGYGSGDSCGAYGNRNFYLYFNDWFGSPRYGNLVRTTSSATVYIVSGSMKYPVNSLSTLETFSRLGPVGYSTQAYLDSKTTGVSATNLIKSDEASTLYFINAGIRLPLGSCTTASHYARPCGTEITLTSGQVALFSNGPSMTRLYQTTTEKKYYIESGKKREIFDSQSLTDAGVSGNFVRLLDSGIAHLPEGKPLARDGVLMTQSGTTYLYESDKLWTLPSGISSLRAFSGRSSREMTASGIAALSQQGSINGFVQKADGTKYVLDSEGKAELSDASSWGVTFVTLGDPFINSVQDSLQQVNERFVKSNRSGTIYYVLGGKKYSITSWSDFISLHDDASATLATLPSNSVDAIPNGTQIYAPGSLVKSDNSATVYVVTALLSKAPLTSFQISDDYGVSGVRVGSQTSLDAHITSTANLNNFAVCGGKLYLANKGAIYEVDAQASTQFGYNAAVGGAWDALGCAVLRGSQQPLSQYGFVKTDAGKTIYIVQDGKRHPIGSMSKYQSLGGNPSNLLVLSDRALLTIPEGSVIN